MFAEDTISAVATPVGEGGIGIVRISGPQAVEIAGQIFVGIGGKTAFQIPSQQVAYGYIVDPQSGNRVDEVLVLVMRAPRSYTREDVVEIHCHGGSIPIRNILSLTLQYGARLAQPGEFTKRAFLNGRLDLAQAEAVIDIIRAKTDASLKMAIGHLEGALSQTIKNMRTAILRMIAHLEASIDFPEEDIEQIAAQQVKNEVESILEKLGNLLATKETGRILRDGLETVIIGKPNVGKSSLLNAMLRAKRAIVTDIPGTTRDIIEEYVNIRGVPLKMIDTAGIRETSDIVEQIGVEKAREFVSRADLILLLLDASAPLTPEDREVLNMLAGRKAIILINKSDLPPLWDEKQISEYAVGNRVIKISVSEGSGLEELEQLIVDMAYSGQVVAKEGVFINNVRQANLLEQVKTDLEEVLATIHRDMPLDCVVVDLRAAWGRLGEITGDTVGEDIIDQIFTQFCIGK
jgi:tRNA modification GTPase